MVVLRLRPPFITQRDYGDLEVQIREDEVGIASNLPPTNAHLDLLFPHSSFIESPVSEIQSFSLFYFSFSSITSPHLNKLLIKLSTQNSLLFKYNEIPILNFKNNIFHLLIKTNSLAPTPMLKYGEFQ